MKKIIKEMFCSSEGLEATYIYVFMLFLFLFAMFGIRIAAVFKIWKGELLSDTLLIGIATLIVGLITNHSWHKRKSKESKKDEE